MTFYLFFFSILKTKRDADAGGIAAERGCACTPDRRNPFSRDLHTRFTTRTRAAVVPCDVGPTYVHGIFDSNKSRFSNAPALSAVLRTDSRQFI